MSDDSVRAALRSDSPLVVVEAPAGCGKTFQGADYAREVASALDSGRVLVLTHTHAACSVFAEHAKGVGFRLEIRTIDSLIAQIASAYHAGLALPADIAAWVRKSDGRHAELAKRVAVLLSQYPIIAASLAYRYRVVICDEHQDSSGDQHAIVMDLLGQGALVRIFGDPMQAVFKFRGIAGRKSGYDWDDLVDQAHAFEKLETPHRWASGSPDLGLWTLKARKALATGGKIDLRTALPASVQIVAAENMAQKHLLYQLSPTDRRPVDCFERSRTSLLVLTRNNDTAQSLRAFFWPRLPLWEGHTRPALETLVDALDEHQGNPVSVAKAAVAFLGKVGVGVSPSVFGNEFEREVREGCPRARRGKPGRIQELARFLMTEPSHRGAARMLRRLWDLAKSDESFNSVRIDCRAEYWDAIRLGDFETADAGLAEIHHRRAYSRPKPPNRAISNIHKAKGLECGSVIVMPCDAQTFPDKPDARCLLYVALSRATKDLLLVFSRNNPSPLFRT